MRVAIVGGGPAGLYAALSIKRARPSAQVHLFERNRKGATYGFGVVFSDQALDFLKSDDAEIHRVLSAHMEVWPDLQVVHRGEPVVIDGNGFAAIGRIALLDLLCEQCEADGVDLHFEHQIAGPAVPGDWDLVVVADGVHSTLRNGNREMFGAEVTELSNRFAWYGTARPFDMLTLTFCETDFGPFVAHHYRYGADASTFIVECDEATFARAGLGELSEQMARVLCADIFAETLRGHELLDNRSTWRRFPLVTNRHWSAGNMVLVGDALRSAHFSIGSGTRLAMEDVIALVAALRHSGWNIADGLALYEQNRRPMVDKLTNAARASAYWYQAMASRMTLPPYEFTHSYMTRTGRVSDQLLRQIAPRFMTRYDQTRAG